MLSTLINFIYENVKSTMFIVTNILTWTYRPTIEPKKKNQIPKNIRNAVWEKYHKNKNYGKCYICNVDIKKHNKGWHACHVIAHSKGGKNTIENLRTGCMKCNLSMSNQNLYVYIQDNNMKGAGRNNVKKYFREHPDQLHDKIEKNKRK